MNPTQDKNLSTADFVAAGEQRESTREQGRDVREQGRNVRDDRDVRDMREMPEPGRDLGEERGMRAAGAPVNAASARDEQLAPLFLPQIAEGFRARWDDVQIGFVDDPHEAVKQADELVAEVMKSLAESFADERASIEGQVDESDTEHLRVALRRYRSFFQRLLSL